MCFRIEIDQLQPFKGIAHLNFFKLLIILSLLFIGGIERNPGPSSSYSKDSISILSATEHIIEDKFSIVHYNVQSIAYKMDVIQSELCNFDVICITESWLDDRTSDDDIKIENFKLFRRDRPGDHHGGRTSDSLNEGLPIKITREKFHRK